MTNIEFMAALVFFGCLWLPFAVVGMGFLFFPRKAIDSAVRLGKKYPGYDVSNHPNLYSKGTIFLYRLGGIMFISFPAVPFFVILSIGQ